MTISIAMATYNGGRYIEEQLASFASQTLLPDELVVSDDCSNDDTLAIVERFTRHAPFAVRIRRNAHTLGFGQNFGKAIGLCGGDLIFLSDQDDVWFPEKLGTVSTALDRAPGCFFVINDLEISDGDLRRTGLTGLGQRRALGTGHDSFDFGCCMAFRASIRPLILPIPEVIVHDVWINMVALAADARCLLESPLQLYRRHGNNTSQSIGNSLSRVRWVDQFAAEPIKTSKDYYLGQRDLLGVLVQRFENLGTEGYRQLNASRPFQDVIARLEARREALATRGALVESGWLSRKLLATVMWAKGDYRHFRGWKSFAKDVLR